MTNTFNRVLKCSVQSNVVFSHFTIQQRLDPLLCNDRELGGYARAVSG
jgi:hypothetical protein